LVKKYNVANENSFKAFMVKKRIDEEFSGLDVGENYMLLSYNRRLISRKSHVAATLMRKEHRKFNELAPKMFSVEKSLRNKNLDAISKRASQPYIVHIQDCSCTCPTYTLSGFPCKHVFFIFSELEIPWPEFFKNSTRFHFDRAYIDKQNQVIESAFLQLPMLPDFSSYYQDLPAANSPEHIVTSSNCEDESPCISPIFKFISETREFAATLNNDGWSIKSIMESSDVSDEKKK
jgi:hypothetical protein